MISLQEELTLARPFLKKPERQTRCAISNKIAKIRKPQAIQTNNEEEQSQNEFRGQRSILRLTFQKLYSRTSLAQHWME